ncbi:hypothetical protein [Streptomyces sp. NPDC001889]
MTVTGILKDAVRGPGAGWRVAGAAALALTAVSQHPDELFGRSRRKDHLGTIPNWRFFAPHPSVHDSELIHRTLSHTGETSAWSVVPPVRDRKARQVAWYPDRRVPKAVFDLGSDILRVVDKGFSTVRERPSYRVLVDFLRREIRESGGGEDVKGFQFALVSSAGYDLDEKAEWQFISPYTSALPRTRIVAAQGK